MTNDRSEKLADVIPMWPTDTFAAHLVLGARCSLCERVPDLAELAVHDCACALAAVDERGRACRCARVVHVQLGTRGPDWVNAHFELRCFWCTAEISDVLGDDGEEDASA